jgi:hypothetical protein
MPNSAGHQVAENEASGIRFTAKKECSRLIEKCLGKGWIALNTLDNGFLEITG